jgi:hypothetical protein
MRSWGQNAKVLTTLKTLAKWEFSKTHAKPLALSRQTLFETVPGVVRRKQLGKKVLGLI